ncbi:MAG: nucleoside triphosphate pyrophosphohydrolase [Nitrospirales bacterium]
MEPHTPTPSSSPPPNSESLSDVVSIMSRLRGANGCPWDREQTAQSLKPFLLEEVYEVLEALDSEDPAALREELGDLLLQILFQSQIASEQDLFSYHDVVKELGEKLIRRHPHVFNHEGEISSLKTSSEVIHQWDHLKQQEQAQKQPMASLLGGIPKISPSLQRAFQVQKRAARGGFDWDAIEPVLDKVKEELDELYTATANTMDTATQHNSSLRAPHHLTDVEDELGDVLFSLVNVSRFLKVNPEEALRKSTNKFIARFQFVETQATSQGRLIKDCTPQQLDQWWEAAKHQERSSPQASQKTEGVPHE